MTTKLSKFEYYQGKYLLHVVSSYSDITLLLGDTKIKHSDSFRLIYDDSLTAFIFEVAEPLNEIKIELLNQNNELITYDISNKFPIGAVNLSFNKVNKIHMVYKSNSAFITNKKPSEIKFVKSMLKDNKWKQVLIRLGYKFYNKNENIIVMDRPSKGGDCGEAFYDELVRQGFKNIFFGLSFSKAMPGEYDRLKAKGYNLLNYDDSTNNIFRSKWKQKVMSSKIILSSSAQNLIYKTNEYNLDYIKDLYDLKFVFLSHGVFQGPLKTSWINPYNEDHQVDYFVANCEIEAKILEDKHAYNEIHDWVLRTGMPRYSAIHEGIEENVIGIFPTWRKDIFFDKSIKSIVETDLFKTWKSFLENEELINALKKNNWKIDFVLHPFLCKYHKDFNCFNSEYITISKGLEIDYNEKIGRCKIGLTDYSGIIYDIAYKNKPTFYYHFSKLADHTYESSFDYVNEVPINVFEDENKLIPELIKTIKESEHVDNGNFFFHQGENHSNIIIDILKEKGLI